MDTLQINRVPMFTRSEDSGERPVDPSIIRSSEGFKEAILAETQPGFVRGCRNTRRIVHTAAAQARAQKAADKEQQNAEAGKKKADRTARLLLLKGGSQDHGSGPGRPGARNGTSALNAIRATNRSSNASSAPPGWWAQSITAHW